MLPPAAAGTTAVAGAEADSVVVVAVDRSREAPGAADLHNKKVHVTLCGGQERIEQERRESLSQVGVRAFTAPETGSNNAKLDTVVGCPSSIITGSKRAWRRAGSFYGGERKSDLGLSFHAASTIRLLRPLRATH